MSYDGIVLRAAALELDNTLKHARIEKIYQPTKNELLIHFRQPGQTHKLLISTLTQEAGIYLTTQTRQNPSQPPLFCMVLRKHLENGKILSIRQIDLERVLEITCEVIDELGEQSQRKLIVEIMGKHSNIILVEQKENKILDAIHRVSSAVSRYRQILPGMIYQNPPPQEKKIAWEIQEDDFYELMLSQPLSQNIKKALLNLFSGLGPQTVSEIIFRTNLDPLLTIEYCGEYELNKLWQALSSMALKVKKGEFSPEVIVEKNIPQAFSAIALTHFPASSRRPYTVMNEALDFYFSYKKSANTIQQKKTDLQQIIKKEISRCEKKAAIQLQAINDAQEKEEYRLWGELLTAYLHNLKPGKEVTVTNYYDPEGKSITIPLDEQLSLSENAQHYFQKYQKAKNTSYQAQIQLNETQAELDYLESLANSLDNVTTLFDLQEVRTELIEAKYLKTTPQKIKNKELKQEKSSPTKLIFNDWEIYFGKNNYQNDQVTMKIAKPQDMWLHTKDIPGAHVLIRNPQEKTIPNQILECAALIAAYYSRARNSTHVPVDYTLKKHVWKLKGAKPGMVYYENQKTVYVTPSKDTLESLLGIPE